MPAPRRARNVPGCYAYLYFLEASVCAERDEIRGLVETLARMLEGEWTVAGWRAFLLTLADVLGDPEIENLDELTESCLQVERFYARGARWLSDFVFNRPDRAEMIAVNEEFMGLRREIDVRLARATSAQRGVGPADTV